MTDLHLHAVNKRFGATLALNDIDLTIRSGKITALVGRSGCGKSTLIKLMNGLLRPTQGTVTFGGVPLDYSNLTALRRTIGYAVQGTGLFPHLTAGANISLVASLEGWSDEQIAQRLRELLALTHLAPELLEKYPYQLSGGQEQRVGLCRAIMLRPQVLLLDEPFAAIDPLTRRDIHQQLLALHHAEPVTMVLVTHDMAEALLLADTIVIIEAGRVVSSHNKYDLLANSNALDANELLLALMAGESV
jgi:osmoprotectant transport system ATP-binding protein